VTGAEAAARERRLAEVVAAVARQALADWQVRRIALLDDGSPEAELAARWLGERLPPGAVHRVDPGPEVLESLLQTAGASAADEGARLEAHRLLVRLVPDALPALPANKTALLLGGALPPEPLLPLGDLFAGEIRALTGNWSAPAAVRDLAERSGGVERLDQALRAWSEGRDAGALELLPAGVRPEVRGALARGAASRLALRVVPKIGSRTLGVDLFE
jgi:MoxR-like ATPase